MPTVPIKTCLYERIQQVAEKRKEKPESLVEEIIQEYLEKLEMEKLLQEEKAFAAIQGELKRRYPGQYVALHQGEVIDHDADLRSLCLRVQNQMGETPVLIRRVDSEPEREVFLRTPVLEREGYAL